MLYNGDFIIVVYIEYVVHIIYWGFGIYYIMGAWFILYSVEFIIVIYII